MASPKMSPKEAPLSAEPNSDIACFSSSSSRALIDKFALRPERSMERTIAKQAEAEREKRAVIINSEGELAAANNIAEAAKVLSYAPGALSLRTLQAINDISSDQSNTVIFMTPIEVLEAFKGFGNKLENK